MQKLPAFKKWPIPVLPKIIPLILLGIFFTPACSNLLESPPPNAPSGEAGKVVRLGEFEERVEIQNYPINNCNDQAETVQIAERSRTLEQSVEIVIPGEATVDIAMIQLAVGAEYGIQRGVSLTDSSSLELKAPPGKFPVFTIAWKEKWEKGYVVVKQDGKEEKIPYLYLASARAEKLPTKYFDCTPAGLATATAQAIKPPPEKPSPSPEKSAAQTPPPSTTLPTPDWETAYEAGKKAYAQENYTAVIDYMTQVINAVPDKTSAYVYRGIAYYEKGDYDQAIRDYNQAIQLDPDYAAAYNERGLAYYKKGDYDQAIRDYNQAIQLDPDYALAYNNRGLAYYEKGDYDQAIRDYNQAIQLDPDYAAAYYNRGLVYKKIGERQKAIADFQRSLDLETDPYWRDQAQKQLKELGL